MSEYYDILVNACGFLNRVRTVEVPQGDDYVACTLAALRGEHGQRQALTYFDTKVVTDEVAQVLRRYQAVINDRRRTVFASVTLSDLTVETFTFKQGPRQGELGVALKTRLLAINTLALEGQVVYRRADEAAPAKPAMNGDADTAESELGQLIHDPRLVVRLAPDDPEFAAKRQALRKAGYRWQGADGCWVLEPTTH